MRVAYLDPVSGISGDMFVACFLDAGVDLETVKAGLGSLELEGYSISSRHVLKKGLESTRFVVDYTEKAHEHRNLPSILSIIDNSSLSARVKDAASRTFGVLAEAEGQVHGVPPKEVGFHEVGAVDSIIDIVSAAIVLESAGVEQLLVGPLPTGRGVIQSAHGPLPVPAPATTRLLAGFDVIFRDIEGELITPTGAAIVKALGTPVGASAPAIRVESVGYGAGAMDFEGVPNVARVFLGELKDEVGSARPLDVIETTVDDATPQIFGYLIDKLLDDGAYDVFTTPVLMKKSRPGVLLTVLSPPERTDALTRAVFRETPTLGIRVCRQWRRELGRRTQRVTTQFGEISVKVSVDTEGLARGIPEYESCASVAKAKDVPLWQVWNEARRAWEKSQGE